MKLGTCYYPEHWPEQLWADDAKRMRDLGLTYVRIAEFAWSRIEPQPGQFDFAWLDRAIDALTREKLKLIMCTPSATPPRWMLDRHPDMLALDENGFQRKFGSRRHYCFSHQGYRESAISVVETIARRYGKHNAVVAWQIDNEYGCHDTTYSYSEHARRGFQVWLRKQYHSIDNLNRDWGNVFWSQEYKDFAEIDLPNQTVCQVNPSHYLDFCRFSSDQVRLFQLGQVKVVREHSPGRAVVHNFMGAVLDFDHFKVGADIDVAAWDSYPIGQARRVGRAAPLQEPSLRQGDPDFQAFHHDLYCAVGRGRAWVMEQQPGPVNWDDSNPVPMQGMVRLWTWEAFAHGIDLVSYFRWRQCPFAQEQMHAGILRADNKPAQAYDEITELKKEFAKITDLGTPSAQVALVFDYESAWAWRITPHGEQFRYLDLVMDFYRSLRLQGVNVKIISADTQDIASYKLVVIPGLLHWRPSMLKALQEFDGVTLIGPRTGSKTKNFTIPASMPPDASALFPFIVSCVDTFPAAHSIPLAQGGTIRTWREMMDSYAEHHVIERTEDGHPIVLKEGNHTYLAGWPDQIGLDRIIRRVLDQAKLDSTRLLGALRSCQNGGYRFFFNYGTSPVVAPVKFHGEGVSESQDYFIVKKCVVGQDEIPPAGVAIYELPSKSD